MPYAGPGTTGRRNQLGCVHHSSDEFPICSEETGIGRKWLTCYCDTDLCNIINENSFKCFVCTKGGGEDNLCAPDETPEEKACPLDMKFCKNIWVKHKDAKMPLGNYKGCSKGPPKDKKHKFTNKQNLSFCRVERRKKDVLKQECYCKANLCNSYIDESGGAITEVPSGIIAVIGLISLLLY